MDKLAIAGGVASNSALRAVIQEECTKNNIRFYSPSPILCTDNAAMIGAAAYYEYMNSCSYILIPLYLFFSIYQGWAIRIVIYMSFELLN